MYYLFDLAPASLDCFPFFSLSIIETKIILIQNLKCGHLCFIWSLVAVRIPWGPRVELIRQPVEFFGFACQHARDLVLCHMLSQSLMRPHPYSESQSQFLCTHFQSQSQYQYWNSSQSSTRSPVVGYAQFWQKRWKFKIDHQAECLLKLPIASIASELSRIHWVYLVYWAQAACPVPVYVECRLKPKQCRNCLPVCCPPCCSPNRCPPLPLTRHVVGSAFVSPMNACFDTLAEGISANLV